MFNLLIHIALLSWLFGSDGPPRSIGEWTYYTNDRSLSANRLPEVGYKLPSRVDSYTGIRYNMNKDGTISDLKRYEIKYVEGDFSISCSEENRMQIGVTYAEDIPDLNSSVNALFAYYPQKFSLEFIEKKYAQVDESWTFDMLNTLGLDIRNELSRKAIEAIVHQGEKNKRFVGWDWGDVVKVLEALVAGPTYSFIVMNTYHPGANVKASLPLLLFDSGEIEEVAKTVVEICRERGKNYRRPIE